MATKTLNTRITLKVDTTANWSTATLVLLKGEVAIEIPESGEYKIKIGDGVKTFKDLPYASMTPTEIKNLINSGAIQTVSLSSGTNNGTVALTVDGVKTDNVAVKGLGSAAYTNSSAYASAGHGHNISGISGLQSALDGKSATGHTHDDRYYTESEMNTKLSGKANSSHTHGSADITSLDVSKLTGVIGIEHLPAGALERCVVVTDDTARFALTTAKVQQGDTVKVTSTGKMYLVTDESKLNSEAGYEVYTAGSATSVPWNGVTGKPSTFTPSSHTHDDRYYTETEINNKLANYLPLSGGTMTGALNFANGIWNVVGDDVAIGDMNIGGTLGIMGKNGNTSIKLVQYGASTTNGSTTPGVAWTCTGNGTSTISGILSGTFSGSLSGNASSANKATNDGINQNIANTYIKDIAINDSIMTITKGSETSLTLNIKDKLYSGDLIKTKNDLDNFIESNVFKFGHIDPIEGYNGLEKNDGIILSTSWKSSANYGHQIYINDDSYALRHRYRNKGAWSDWASILDSTNYNNYAPTKTGGGASGTWGISIAGNASTATNVAWSGVTGKPSTFTPSSHTHTIANINGLQTALDGKANNHSHPYLPLSGGTVTGGVKITGRYLNNGDDEGLVIGLATNNYCGVCLGSPTGERSVFYFTPGKPFWRYTNSSGESSDITHPKKAGTIALTSDIPTNNNQLSNGAGYITSSGSCKYATSAGSANSANSASTATKLATARTISITGSVIGSGSFDGSGNITIATTTGHTHSYVADSSDGKNTTFAYSKAGLNYGDYSWLAGWNGYELRAVNKNQFATAGHTHGNYLGAANANGFYGMAKPDGNTSDWIRTTQSGIIPYQAGNRGNGHSGIGTSGWYFSFAYVDDMYTNKTIIADKVTLQYNSTNACLDFVFS